MNVNGSQLIVDLEVDVEDQGGGQVEGEAEVRWGDNRFDAEITKGKIDGKEIDWKLEIDDPTYRADIVLEGELEDKDVLSGDCTYKDKAIYEGDFELER